MFFDEKMQLVWVDGPFEQLEPFVQQCCIGNTRVHPTTAVDKMSSGMGFAPPELENVWAKRIEDLEQMAAGLELPEEEPDFEQARSAQVDEYLKSVADSLEKKRAEMKALQEQKKICEDGVEQFSHFSELDVDFSETLECEYISIRFGRLPKAGYQTLLREHGDDLYVFFICCSEDEDYYWGMYFAPRERRALIDGIFAGLYFERIRLPGASGTPVQIVENLKENLLIIEQQLLDDEKEFNNIWQKEKLRCARIYAAFCRLARVVELCKCAVVRGDHFFYAVWVEQPVLKEFLSTCDEVGKLHMTLDMTLPLKKWRQLNEQ